MNMETFKKQAFTPIKVSFNGETLLIRPLSVKRFREYHEEFKKLDGTKDEKLYYALSASLFAESLITEEGQPLATKEQWVIEMDELPLLTVSNLMTAVMEANGGSKENSKIEDSFRK